MPEPGAVRLPARATALAAACAAGALAALIGAASTGAEPRESISIALGSLAVGGLAALVLRRRVAVTLEGGPDRVSIPGAVLFAGGVGTVSVLVVLGVVGDPGGGNLALLADLFVLAGALAIGLVASIAAVPVAVALDVGGRRIARGLIADGAARARAASARLLLAAAIVAGVLGAPSGALLWPIVAAIAAAGTGAAGVRGVAALTTLALVGTLAYDVHAVAGRIARRALPACSEALDAQTRVTPLVASARAVPGVVDVGVQYDGDARVERAWALGPGHTAPSAETLAAVARAIETTACREPGAEDEPLRADVAAATAFDVDLVVTLRCGAGPTPDLAAVESSVRAAFAEGRIVDLGGPRQWDPPVSLPAQLGGCAASYVIDGDSWENVWSGSGELEPGQYLALRSLSVGAR